ncbi:hypothetical protein FOCC_FOCC010922 [Frankliniella occidentalis]|nr:hypothetical protein FOCC_FOCC010922 [Frankliniella occidentalis]
MDYIRNLRPANDDTLSSYIDGEQFATHPFFIEHPDAFQLGFYYDDVETTNPNGSKVGGHTLSYFACKILNAPPHLNAVIGGYHTIALAHTQDVKKYGFRPILQYFIDELRELESPEGVVTYIGPNRIVQRACLCAVLGDTKAVHEILGFLAPGARHFCRLCMISRPQLHAGIDMEEPRERNLHNNHIATNQANPARAVENGVSANSCLHDLEYFHATSNYALDSMHDIAEGVAEFEIKLVLRECIRRGYFRSCHLNRRIKGYNVGKTDVLNKATDNFSDAALQNAGVKHNLSQTSAQTFCLLRVIPFLLDNLEDTPDEDDLLNLLLILQEIVHIVRAPKLTRTLMPYLQNLIEDHRRLFMRLFPNERPINKHHHLEHYVDCILKMGPIEQFNCMRSEASMRPFKRHVVTCGTYRNVCKTAMDLCQITQAVRWGNPGEIHVVPKFEQIRKKHPTAIRNCHTAVLLRARGFEDEDVVYKVKSVLVYRREFPLNTFVVLRKRVENPDGLEAFGKIVGIIVANDDEDVWLEIEEWTSEYQHPRFNACVVTRPPQPILHLLDPVDLPLHAPISALSDNSYTGNTYLKLRHVVV